MRIGFMIERTEEYLQPESPAEIRRKYWMPLEGAHRPGAWDALYAGYCEPHRAYHGWGHIAALLEKLNALKDLAARPDIIAIAAFWHDAVYTTRDRDGRPRPDYENVRDSASLFRRYTLLKSPACDAVFALIMATADHLHARPDVQFYDGFEGDLDLFLDLDLSSLASPWDEFEANLGQIRSEFCFASDAEFYSAHLRTLQDFAGDDVELFRRAETRAKWQGGARANVKRCVSELTKKLAACCVA
jgi:predicted metal-dependent HD superfamily phosphohydrolase